jgi:hypothetical protein
MITKLENINRSEATGSENSRQSFGVRLVTLIIVYLSFASFGCAPAPTNSNSTINSNATASTTMNTNTAANINSNSSTGVSSTAFATKEPEQYSLTMAITGQGSANNKQGTLPQQNIEFARMGTDRRWSLTLPAIGPVVYLEKTGMRYLILPSRNQYVEISPDALGFQLGNAMTPSAMVERLKPRTQYESMGTETINGRPATKYRFTGAADTRTKAGTVQSESFIYIDEATGLPLRADLNFDSSSGGKAHGTIETRDIQLNPDAKLFDVPTTYKKVTAEELKQQVQGFIQFIRAIAPVMAQQASSGSTAAPSPATPATTPGGTPNAKQP